MFDAIGVQGSIELKPQNCDLLSVFRDVMNQHRMEAKPGISLVVACSKSLPPVIFADTFRLRQVMHL